MNNYDNYEKGRKRNRDRNNANNILNKGKSYNTENDLVKNKDRVVFKSRGGNLS